LGQPSVRHVVVELVHPRLEPVRGMRAMDARMHALVGNEAGSVVW
jgi:hypothetical protein